MQKKCMLAYNKMPICNRCKKDLPEDQFKKKNDQLLKACVVCNEKASKANQERRLQKKTAPPAGSIPQEESGDRVEQTPTVPNSENVQNEDEGNKFDYLLDKSGDVEDDEDDEGLFSDEEVGLMYAYIKAILLKQGYIQPQTEEDKQLV